MQKIPYPRLCFLIILSFLIKSLSVNSQQKFEIGKEGSLQLHTVKNNSSSEYKIPFSKIIVRDYRFDTTKIGYIKNGRIQKITTEPPASHYFTSALNQYFQNNLSPSSEKTLVIILKTLWLQKGSTTDLQAKRIVSKYDLASSGNGFFFSVLESFSLEDSSYQALIRMEHIFSISYYWPRKIPDFILLPFDSLLKKIASINIETHLSNKRKISWSEIHSAACIRFNLPVLNYNAVQKGVFLTFKDFENNLSLHPDFIIRQSKLTDDLYIKKENSEELLTDYWGFYDGSDYYIRVGFNVFKLYRQNNTFDLYGNKYITNLIHNYGYSGGSGVPPFRIKTQSMKVENDPLQLNMDSGEVY